MRTQPEPSVKADPVEAGTLEAACLRILVKRKVRPEHAWVAVRRIDGLPFTQTYMVVMACEDARPALERLLPPQTRTSPGIWVLDEFEVDYVCAVARAL